MRRELGMALLLWLAFTIASPGFVLAAVQTGSASAAIAQDADSSAVDRSQPAPSASVPDSLTLSVEEAVVCLSVDKENRKPVGAGDRFPSDVGHLTCFTRIKGGKGGEVVHAWIHEGHTRARVPLKIGSDSWRTWSTKRILPSWTGHWEVKVMTPDGMVLRSISFTVY